MIPIGDTAPRSGIPFVTLLLIGANIYVFKLLLDSGPEGAERIITQYGLIARAIRDPTYAENIGLATYSVFPFVTAQFLHGDLVHLLSNVWSLWLFGDNVESKFGNFKFLLFYLLTGVGAFVAQYMVYPDSPVPAIGASGAIAGIMGAYFIYFPGANIKLLLPVFILPFFFQVPAILFMMFWFYTQFLSGLSASTAELGGVAWWAHIGGFVCGAVISPLFAKK
jgi:membrane associated rhomboid family serine protease